MADSIDRTRVEGQEERSVAELLDEAALHLRRAHEGIAQMKRIAEERRRLERRLGARYLLIRL